MFFQLVLDLLLKFSLISIKSFEFFEKFMQINKIFENFFMKLQNF